ncbi:MAG: hypothetical protein HYU75_13860 [Betaproteobacteria bacterium]|nr:hypothetical protein [Betaproteobacteria bacterium]
MNYRRVFSGGAASAIQSAPVGPAHRKQKRLEGSGRLLLNGWFISMLGIVIYCYVMLSSEPLADAFTSQSLRGLAAWVSIVLIVLGLWRWFNGYIGLLKEADEADHVENKDLER